jgi:hypothetical protein
MFHFIEVLDLDILHVSVDIDDNSNSYRCFGRTYPNGKQSEEESFELPREKEAVEHGEIDVYRVENQFHADKHGQ